MPKNPRSYEKTRHIALSGLLFALAMALSFIEGSLVIPGLLPGMKLGLANIVGGVLKVEKLFVERN
jgi:heptaprenyl diphosphate synthase